MNRINVHKYEAYHSHQDRPQSLRIGVAGVR